MEKKLIPAPIDGKNITSDWIEDIFDFSDFVVGGKGGKIYTGFVGNRPTNCFIDGNAIFWHIDKFHCGVFNNKSAYDELLKRLKEEDDAEMGDIVVKYDVSMRDELIVMQRFFFKDE